MALDADKNPITEIDVTPDMIRAGGEILYNDADFDRATSEYYAEMIIRAALKEAFEIHRSDLPSSAPPYSAPEDQNP
jgi:hypothetical protein